jgi:GntR family transcriptional regulator of gluconate operon
VDAFSPERVAHVALSQGVVTALRRAIILGELPAGLHLEEPALAEKFGVSRIPIREALGRLAHEGLIRLEPRRGAFVTGATEDDIYDLYELRSLLEAHAVRRAAARIGQEDLRRLQGFVDQMRVALRHRRPQDIAVADMHFHQQVVVSAGSRRLVSVWEQIAGLVGAMLSIADAYLANMTEPVESHQRIIDALARQDQDEAERLIRAHLELAPTYVCDAMRAVRQAADGRAERMAT